MWQDIFDPFQSHGCYQPYQVGHSNGHLSSAKDMQSGKRIENKELWRS